MKFMKKNLLSRIAGLALPALLLLTLAGCGGGEVGPSGGVIAPAGSGTTGGNQDTTGTDKKISVGVNPVPHADILENAVKEVLWP